MATEGVVESLRDSYLTLSSLFPPGVLFLTGTDICVLEQRHFMDSAWFQQVE